MDTDTDSGRVHAPDVNTSSWDDVYTCITHISRTAGPLEAHVQELEAVVDGVKRQAGYQERAQEAAAGRKGETPLHTAIKSLQFHTDAEKRVVNVLIEQFPELILQDRGDSPEYRGQTPLHMGVTKGNRWFVRTLLEHMDSLNWGQEKAGLLHGQATGKIFTNTIMMAEVPLSIAALTFNKKMLDRLLEHGAELDATNSRSENICHSLVRYAYLYPDKLENVLKICEYVSEDTAPHDAGTIASQNRKLRKKIWLMKNIEGNTPLLLATKLGQDQIFNFIMNLEVYCFENTKDGLFDIKAYDVTELDAISYMNTSEANLHGIHCNHQKSVDIFRATDKGANLGATQKSVLRMLLDVEPARAFQFILFPPLRRIIDEKWNFYRKCFYPWMFFHAIFVALLTWYGIERSIQDTNSSSGYDTNDSPNFSKKIPDNAFVTAFGIICVVVGVVYFLQEIIRAGNARMPWTKASFKNPYSNGTFRVMFIFLSLLLVTDFFFAVWEPLYENYCLILAIIDAWFLLIFFVRGLRPFSFFTVLIQKILLGDMFRFFVIIAIELLAFGTAMHMLVQGMATEDPDFLNFGRTLFTMMKIMVGLGEIGILYETRHPTLAVMVFVGFVIMTTLLMMNSLIAIMSRTCSDLVENVGHESSRDMHWKLQRLSIVLFIESVLPLPGVNIHIVGSRYDSEVDNQAKICTRYRLELRSLQDEDGGGAASEDMTTSTWGMRTMATLKHVPWLRNLVKRKHKQDNEDVSDRVEMNNIVPMKTKPVPLARPVLPAVLEIQSMTVCLECNKHSDYHTSHA